MREDLNRSRIHHRYLPHRCSKSGRPQTDRRALQRKQRYIKTYLESEKETQKLSQFIQAFVVPAAIRRESAENSNVFFIFQRSGFFEIADPLNQ